MPLENVTQPQIIQITETLRLKAYDGHHDFALSWYQDPVVYYNSEGITDPDKIPDMAYLNRMYSYLNQVGELYFIEVLENGVYKPIGDTAVKTENPPIAIGKARYRGQGLGKLVLEAVLKRAKEAGIPKITGTVVYDYNEASKRLHESLGYKLVEKKGNELIYELDLNDFQQETNAVDQPMTTLYFVRHAQVNYVPDEQLRPLSDEGVKQITTMKMAFKDITIDYILSSPYKRAVDTISGVASDKGLSIITDHQLRERQVTDGYIEDFEAFTMRQWQDRNYKLENGESLNEVQKRATIAIEEVLINHAGKSVLIGTHGTFLSTVLNYYDPTFAHKEWQEMPMPAIYKMVFNRTAFVKYEAVIL